MISTQFRVMKPYALPVQCVSYTGMTVAELRRILNNIVTNMIKKGMEVTGMFYGYFVSPEMINCLHYSRICIEWRLQFHASQRIHQASVHSSNQGRFKKKVCKDGKTYNAREVDIDW